MPTQDIILAQASTTDDIIRNLINSENELNNLDNQVNTLREEYRVMINNIDQPSFFNFDNVYFWFVIVGLLLLAFGLWFLMLELKKGKVRQAKIEEPQKEVRIETIPVVESKPATVKNKKVIKVKVRKVKKQ